MTLDVDSSCIAQAADLIRSSTSIVAFTGAGISTPSGIPDFRSSGIGLWNNTDPMEVASISVFRTHPERFFNWLRPLAGFIHNAKPNAGHQALAEMQRRGKLHAVITQNIDGLHQRAGNAPVHELHGSVRTASCQACKAVVDQADYLPGYLKDQDLPLCSFCGGLLKPDIILFGENLPAEAWAQADIASRICDLMLVIGSSLEVTPAAYLPAIARENKARLVIINQSPTPLDEYAVLTLHTDASQLLPEIVSVL